MCQISEAREACVAPSLGQHDVSRVVLSCVARVARRCAATLWPSGEGVGLLNRWIAQVSMLATAPRVRHAASRRQPKKLANTSSHACFPRRSQRIGWAPSPCCAGWAQLARVMLFSRKPFPLAHKECELVLPQVLCPFLVPVWDALGESEGGGKRFASAKRFFRAPIILHGHRPFLNSALQRNSDACFHPTRFLCRFAVGRRVGVGVGEITKPLQ